MNFKDLGLSPAILKALEAQGYQAPTPIQSGAIPPALTGRDVLGIAQTGTGKTCAFATPILQRLAAKPVQGSRPIRSLILTPTRELALQIQESFVAYGKNLPLRSAVIFGGVGQQPQVDQLRRGVDVLVATPGRLLDLQGQGLIDLSRVEIFVLDEADRMLDMGFIHDVRRVLKLLPERKQTLFFSATMPPEVQSLVDDLLHDPAKVAVTPVSSPVEVIHQSLYMVDKPNKSKLLAYLVNQPGVKNALVFSRTKHGANKIAGELVKAGISAAAIHGNKSQTARQQALGDFKAGRIKVLVATDIAARGIDIEELSHVFNYNLPDVPETYVHRIGRTGRAGHGGVAVSFCDISEKDDLKGIEKLLGKKIPVVENHPWPMENFTPPQRDKHGKLINPEDAEARQAARQKREDRRAAGLGAVRGQKQVRRQPDGILASGSERMAKRPSNPSATAPSVPKPTPVKDRTPGQKRQAAGYKPSKTLDEALTAMSPRDIAQGPAARRDGAKAPRISAQPSSRREALPTEDTKSERDLAFEKWMAEERAIQAQKGYTDALSGDTVMDATARLLAPKRAGSDGPERKRERRPIATDGPATGQKQAKGKALSGILAAQPGSGSGHGPSTSATAPKPRRDASNPSVTASKQPKPTQKAAAPAKPKQKPQKSTSTGAGSNPARGTSSLEERKARIRAEAKARRRGPADAPKPAYQKDSTEQPSLMKPYYLNDD